MCGPQRNDGLRCNDISQKGCENINGYKADSESLERGQGADSHKVDEDGPKNKNEAGPAHYHDLPPKLYQAASGAYVEKQSGKYDGYRNEHGSRDDLSRRASD